MKVTGFRLFLGNSAISCKTGIENVFYYETVCFILLYEIIRVHWHILISANLMPKSSRYIVIRNVAISIINIKDLYVFVMSQPGDPLHPAMMSRTITQCFW